MTVSQGELLNGLRNPSLRAPAMGWVRVLKTTRCSECRLRYDSRYAKCPYTDPRHSGSGLLAEVARLLTCLKPRRLPNKSTGTNGKPDYSIHLAGIMKAGKPSRSVRPKTLPGFCCWTKQPVNRARHTLRLRATRLLLLRPFKRSGRTAGSRVNDVGHPTFSTSLFNWYRADGNSSTPHSYHCCLPMRGLCLPK